MLNVGSITPSVEREEGPSLALPLFWVLFRLDGGSEEFMIKSPDACNLESSSIIHR